MTAIDARGQSRILALWGAGLDDAKRQEVERVRIAAAQLLSSTELAAELRDALLGLLSAHALTGEQKRALIHPLADTLAATMADAVPGPRLVGLRSEVGA